MCLKACDRKDIGRFSAILTYLFRALAELRRCVRILFRVVRQSDSNGSREFGVGFADIVVDGRSEYLVAVVELKFCLWGMRDRECMA